ncbi:MAG: glyoxalase [Deltaproteobacteria bacterium CG11_big_fil_rev_8_21_14_0_20_49_13]|nr:MAG: glyoxalase [Deltaproteobacteria bacterium CG11_big_fil_rev_8_21_14_0_20_49_13]
MKCNIILYVGDQERSTLFYKKLLAVEPILNVPGMTEFELSEQCVLGLMPEKGIKRLLGATIPDPETTNGASRAEIYFKVADPEVFLKRANEIGSKTLSPLSPRDWGDEAGYVMDPDGHVIAFARKLV